jgi:hypothetical protein
MLLLAEMNQINKNITITQLLSLPSSHKFAGPGEGY